MSRDSSQILQRMAIARIMSLPTTRVRDTEVEDSHRVPASPRSASSSRSGRPLQIQANFGIVERRGGDVGRLRVDSLSYCWP